MRHLILALTLALSACASFPELDARLDAADRNAPWPELVPTSQLIAAAGAPGAPAASADLAARIAALDARAAALRGPVIDPAEAVRLGMTPTR